MVGEQRGHRVRVSRYEWDERDRIVATKGKKGRKIIFIPIPWASDTRV